MKSYTFEITFYDIYGNDVEVATKVIKNAYSEDFAVNALLNMVGGYSDFKGYQHYEYKILEEPKDIPKLHPDQVRWVVNQDAELGVKIGNQLFFLYKGESIEMTEESEDRKWRYVEKREFGEVCRPANFVNIQDKGNEQLHKLFIDNHDWNTLGE